MKYKYIGDGAGIPGLPHEISDEEAARDGLTELLKAAIENGKYIESTPRPSTAERKTRSSAQGNDRKDVSNG